MFSRNPKLEEFTRNEIESLTAVDNDHILGFYEVLRSPNNTYFVYEFCNGGDLEGYFEKKGTLKEDEAMKIFIDLLDAFKALVEKNIVHRDLKPSNILIHDGEIKLGDFGFCKQLAGSSSMTRTCLGSPIYMAPEILNA